jgi:hypothetical protein
MKQTKGERGTKEAFFAQYFGQQVIVTKGTYSKPTGSIYKIRHDIMEALNLGDLTKVKLAVLLKPLTQITDEDAIEFFDILWAKDETHRNKPIEFKIDFGKDWALAPTSERYGLIPTGLFHGVDFLRSKGYALPYLGISVDEMCKLGWIKLIE